MNWQGCRCSGANRVGVDDSLSVKRSRYFAASGDEERAQDRPHFIFGDYQRRRKLPPEALTRTDDQGWAGSLDPLEGIPRTLPICRTTRHNARVQKLKKRTFNAKFPDFVVRCA